MRRIAADKFDIHDAVELTREGRQTFPSLGLFGLVKGFSRAGEQFVRIQVDGALTIRRFHMDFWRTRCRSRRQRTVKGKPR